MEISSEIGQASIGGITQPIIGQKKVDLGEIRLRDGESSLIGGIMDDSQTKSLSGIPGLAQIPILKYLFGQTTTDHSSDEPSSPSRPLIAVPILMRPISAPSTSGRRTPSCCAT